ncbi:MAG: VWA domain-containing protein [Jatrophihabitans sp.]|nr:MAG: VWA domain-containing protein [Jatrophihabitans sp.]
MHFLSPAWLLLLVPVAALLGAYLVVQLRRKRFVARFSNVQLLGSVAPRRPGWRRHLTFALLLAGLTVLSLGVARPSAAVQVPRERATVILAIDVSLSMEATDVLPSRIKAAQQAAKTFISLLPPRINLGLIEFARTATVLVPPTLDRGALERGVDALRLQNYTAIGDAVFSALDAINVFTRTSTPKGEKPAPARIVLMSDGGNTIGRSLASAAEAAKKADVSVSTIAFGTDNGTVTYEGQTIPVPADKPALRQLAVATGGSFHTATTVNELESVYHDIGSQIGYAIERRDISWRFLLAGVLLLFVAGGASMLWAGRLA